MDYKTVKGTASGSFVEKKSEFIGTISHVKTVEEAMEFVAQVKAQNRKARHNVYAYIVRDSNSSGYSDDGEPQGTGGIPVLNVLKARELTDVCVVVTRYFGGILLGTGGLTRAYSHGCALAVDEADLKIMLDCFRLEISCDYSFYGKLDKIFSEFEVKTLDSQFADDVTVKVLVKANLRQKLEDKLIDLSNGRVKISSSELLNDDFS